jgi:hypothetical protein
MGFAAPSAVSSVTSIEGGTMATDITHLDTWTGETDELAGYEEVIASDEDLCEQLFCSKREAFAVGLRLGSRLDVEAIEPSDSYETGPND